MADSLKEIEQPCIAIPTLDEPKAIDIFATKKHKAWDKTTEARCDFSEHIGMTRRAGIRFMYIWKKTPLGRTLTDIKSDDSMVELFAENVARLINDCLGSHLDKGQWCIVTTPKRRHTTRNFATLISLAMATRLHIPFYEDVASCHSKHRVGAVFTLNLLPEEPNIIVFDDFVTTGSTLLSMANLLRQYDKNLVFFTGINNIL